MSVYKNTSYCTLLNKCNLLYFNFSSIKLFLERKRNVGFSTCFYYNRMICMLLANTPKSHTYHMNCTGNFHRKNLTWLLKDYKRVCYRKDILFRVAEGWGKPWLFNICSKIWNGQEKCKNGLIPRLSIT